MKSIIDRWIKMCIFFDCYVIFCLYNDNKIVINYLGCRFRGFFLSYMCRVCFINKKFQQKFLSVLLFFNIFVALFFNFNICFSGFNLSFLV